MDSTRVAAFFADLPPAELDEVATAMTEVEVDEGANVTTVDDYGSAVYLIEEGRADVLIDGAIQTLGPGDTFGEIALLLTGERTAMRLLTLSDQDFQRIRERVPELERSLRRLGIERAGR